MGLIEKDKGLKNEFKKLIGNQEIYKFIIDLLDNSQNILLIIDGEKKELPEITNTYTITPCKVGFILLALSLYFLFTPYEEGDDI